MMKKSTVSLSIWFAQVLTLCALHENLLTTQQLDISTRTSEKLKTNQDIRTKTATTPVITTTTSADELLSDRTPPMTPTVELSSFKTTVEANRRNTSISTSHHSIMSLTEMAVSTNTTSVMTQYQETGTGSENTSINIQEISTSRAPIQLDHDVQTTTSMSWTLEDRMSNTEEADTALGPLIYSTLLNDTDVTLTTGSSGRKAHQSPAPSTAGTHMEILPTNQTPPDDTRNTIKPTGTSGRIDITATPVHSTLMENTEKTLVSSTQMLDWKMEENTIALTTTQGNMYNNLTNTTWRDGAWSTNTEDTWSTNITMSKNISTSDTETPHWTEYRMSNTEEADITNGPLIYSTLLNETDVTLTTGSSGRTDHQSPAPTTAETHMEILSTNQTHPDDITNKVTPTGTSGRFNITATHVHATLTENTEETLVSSTQTLDWKMENTEALPTTQSNMHDNLTNTTWRDGAWSTNAEDTWRTDITMSKNISTSDMETSHWTTCFKDSSSHPHRFSKMACFITMWAIGMIASIFLGLTVFLWVRLSITKKKASLRVRGGRDRKRQGPTAKEKESLWAEPGSSTEERVEFWYANRSMIEEDKRRQRERQGRTRKNRERQVGMEEEMWIQPKVTLKDITEFWYANRKVRHDEETPCELNEE